MVFTLVKRRMRSPTFRQLDLGDYDVHVWHIPLDQATRDLWRLEQLLSSDERMRLAKFHFHRDRQRFIKVHGMLRSLLAEYRGSLPEALRFGRNQYGKPTLLTEEGALCVEFNLAHSGDLALIAIARATAVGIDIEHKRPIADIEGIAESYFSTSEWNALRTYSGEAQIDAFYACWTRKEAYVKAIGKGLSMSFNLFEVPTEPYECLYQLSVQGASEKGKQWSLYSLAPAPGFAGALVAEGTSHRIALMGDYLPEPAG